jgi:hypothetical protein
MKKRFKGLFFAFIFSIVVLLGLWVLNLDLAIKTDIKLKNIERLEYKIDSLNIQVDALEQLEYNLNNSIIQLHKKRRATK